MNMRIQSHKPLNHFVACERMCMIHILWCIIHFEGHMKRTNVEIDEKKLKAAKKAFDIDTTKDLIEFALTELLKIHNRKNILKLKGKIQIDLDLDESRKMD